MSTNVLVTAYMNPQAEVRRVVRLYFASDYSIDSAMSIVRD